MIKKIFTTGSNTKISQNVFCFCFWNKLCKHDYISQSKGDERSVWAKKNARILSASDIAIIFAWFWYRLGTDSSILPTWCRVWLRSHTANGVIDSDFPFINCSQIIFIVFFFSKNQKDNVFSEKAKWMSLRVEIIIDLVKEQFPQIDLSLDRSSLRFVINGEHECVFCWQVLRHFYQILLWCNEDSNATNV